jgi:hypothetical protein
MLLSGANAMRIRSLQDEGAAEENAIESVVE